MPDTLVRARREDARRKAALRQLARIHAELDAATARRATFWEELAQAPNPQLAAKVDALSRKIGGLWTEARTLRACIQHGSRDVILDRARSEAHMSRYRTG